MNLPATLLFLWPIFVLWLCGREGADFGEGKSDV